MGAGLDIKHTCLTMLLVSGICFFPDIATPVSAQSTGAVSNSYPQSDEIRALDKALEDVKAALEDVQLRFKYRSARLERLALTSARKKLLEAIETLEWQRQNLIEDTERLKNLEEAVTVKRQTVHNDREMTQKRYMENLNKQLAELSKTRTRLVEEFRVTQEGFAEEIEELQNEVQGDDKTRNVRLRALREAELAVADLEQYHLSAIAAAEEELMRNKKRLQEELTKKNG